MNIRKIFTSILLIAFAIVGKAQTVGDLAVLSANAVKPDKIKLVALNTIPPNSTFIITDNPWTGTQFKSPATEGYLTWTSPSTAITPGSIITFSSTTTTGSSTWTTSNSSVDIGTYTINGTFAIATADDNIFILFRSTWTLTPALSDFIWGYNTDAWITTGTPTSNNSYLPSSLTNYNTSFPIQPIYDGYFANSNIGTSSVTVSNSNKCAMITLLTDTSKWVKNTTNTTTGLTPPSYNITFASTTTISYTGSPFCNTGTGSVSLAGTSGGTYSSTSGLSINSSTGAINLANSTAGSYTVSYTYTLSGCSNTAFTNITINSNAFSTGFSIATTPQCLGATTTFTNLSGSGTFSGFGSGTSSFPQTYNNQSIVSNTGQAVIFRIYVYGGSTRDYQVKNFSVIGSTSAGAVTSIWALTSNATSSNSGVGSSSITSASQTLGTNITLSSYNSSNGIIVSPTSTNWSTPIDYNSYIQFSVTPNFGYDLNVSSVTFTERQLSGSGTVSRNLMYSIDGGITFQSVPYAGASAAGLTYSWNFGEPSSASNTSIATNPTHTYSSTGTYAVTLTTTDGACTGTSSQTVTVNGATINSQSTTAATYCQFAVDSALTVTATGTSLTYQWYSNNTNNYTTPNPIASATSSSYTAPTTTTGTLYYFCIVSSSSCTDTSNPVGITIVATPTISTQPSTSTATYCQNATATALSITAAAGSGSISTYQWYSNISNLNSGGTLVATTTANTYTPLTTTVGSLYYYCIVTNSNNCTITSNVSGLITVSATPVAGFNINTAFQCVIGNSYIFTNTSTVSIGSLTYNWSYGDSTFSTSTNGSHNYATAGSYLVKLVATSGSCKDSSIKPILMYPKPVAGFNINTTPQCLAGNNFIFTPTCTDTSSGTYNVSWALTGGASATVTGNGANNITAISMTKGSGLNLGLTYNINGAKTGITSGNWPTSLSTTHYVEFKITAKNNGYLLVDSLYFEGGVTNGTTANDNVVSVQYSLDGGTNFSSSILTQNLPDTSSLGNYPYGVKFSSPLIISSGNSITVRLYLYTSNSATSSRNIYLRNFQAINTTTANATSYNWTFGDGGVSTLSSPSHSYSTAGTDTVKLVIGNGTSCKDSTTKTVVINTSPTISSQPATATVNYCLNATTITPLSVVAVGTSLTYQWYSNSSNSNSGGSSVGSGSGGQTDTYTPPTSTAGTKYYYCIISNGTCAVTTNASGAIIINALPTISAPSTTAQTVCVGGTLTALSVTAAAGSGTISTYQWYSNTSNSNSGGTLVSTNSSSLTTNSYTPPTSSVASLYYYCIVTNSNSCTKTSSVSGLITVVAVPTVTISGGTAVCNTTATSTLTAGISGGTGTTTYQWQAQTNSSSSFSNVGSNISTFSASVTSPTQYQLVVTTSGSGCGTATSNLQSVVPLTPPTATLSPTPTVTICTNNTVAFTAIGNTNDINTFQFYQGASLLQTSTSNTYTTPVLTTANSGQSYTVKVTNSPTFDGNINENFWGTPYAVSTGGPAPGFGSNNEINALYVRSDATNLYFAIAGKVSYGSRIMLFIDSKTGGYNTGNFGRNNAPNGVQFFNSANTFDAGFYPDYCLNIGTEGTNTIYYFDLYALSGVANNSSSGGPYTPLGSNISPTTGYSIGANPLSSSLTRGYEIAIPKTALGYTSGDVQVMAMYTADNNGYLSNQFLTRANSGEGDYTFATVNFGNAAPNQIAIPAAALSGTACTTTSTPTVVTVNAVIANNTISSSQTICNAATPTPLTGTTPTGGSGSYTYLWQSSTTGSSTGFAAASGTNNTQNYTPSSLTQNTWFRRVVSAGTCTADTAAAIAITITSGIVYVNLNATGSNNGSSWANAYTDLQTGINAAAVCSSQVWVATATYKPNVYPWSASGTSSRDYAFYLKNNVSVYGGFIGTETLLTQRNYTTNVTTISGDIGVASDTSDNCYHVFVNVNNTSTALLDGFTISGGNATGTGNLTVNGSSISRTYGGGMYNKTASPSLLNCIFSSNTSSTYGAGMYNESSSTAISSCTFSLNTSGNDGAGIYNNTNSTPSIISSTFFSNTSSGGDGGGMCNNSNSSGSVTSCTFTSNNSQRGGGISIQSSSPIITSCIFTSNSVNTSGNKDGAGMHITGTCSPVITKCAFYNNIAGNASTGTGGGITNQTNSSAIITNCIFAGNTANNGGALYISTASPTITNCTMYGNTAYSLGGGIRNNTSTNAVVTNCIIWGNTSNNAANSGIINASGGTITVSYSIVQNGFVGTGNLNTNPLFVNSSTPLGADNTWATADDGLMIGCLSPARNTGTATGSPTTDIIGTTRTTPDMGAYENTDNPVTQSVSIAITTGSQTTCTGTSITFTATPTNGGITPTYQWQLNGSNVGTNSSTYTSAALTNGAVVTCIMTSSLSCYAPLTVTSNSITMSVGVATTSTTNVSICPSALPYSWNGLSFATAGSQTKTGLINSQGCDSAATLNLTIYANTVKDTSTISGSCAVSFLSNSYTASTFINVDTVKSVVGNCDSIIHIKHIIVNPVVVVKDTTSLTGSCAVTFLSNSYTASTFINVDTVKSVSGNCDSISHIKHIIVNPVVVVKDTTNLTGSCVVTFLSNSYTTSTFINVDTVKSINGNCDSIIHIKHIIVNPVKSTINISICPNQLPYHWNGLTFNTAGSQTYHTTNSVGCDSAATLVLTLNPLPTVIIQDTFHVWSGIPAILSITAQNDSLYKWVSNAAHFLNYDTILSPICTTTSAVDYKLIVTSQQGCKITKNVFVRLYTEPNVVNAFSPNDDNRNDYWDLTGLKAYGNFNYKIFDRYGIVVHQGNENSRPWDGKRNGQFLPIGTYYYLIDIHNYKKITGSITLLR